MRFEILRFAQDDKGRIRMTEGVIRMAKGASE
jgi:hypothetical protein